MNDLAFLPGSLTVTAGYKLFLPSPDPALSLGIILCLITTYEGMLIPPNAMSGHR